MRSGCSVASRCRVVEGGGREGGRFSSFGQSGCGSKAVSITCLSLCLLLVVVSDLVLELGVEFLIEDAWVEGLALALHRVVPESSNDRMVEDQSSRVAPFSLH